MLRRWSRFFSTGMKKSQRRYKRDYDLHKKKFSFHSDCSFDEKALTAHVATLGRFPDSVFLCKAHKMFSSATSVIGEMNAIELGGETAYQWLKTRFPYQMYNDNEQAIRKVIEGGWRVSR